MKYINTNKLKKLKINKENACIVMDFDRTITASNSQDSWDASSHMLGNECKQEMENMYKFYAPIELDYNLNIEEKEKYMVEWYSKCMDLYYKYGMTEEKMKKSIETSKLIFRNGAKEFIKKAKEYNIPIIILSAGIGNVIEKFLKDNNCYSENIYIISNFIEFNENGDMVPFNNTKIIHSLNKKMDNKLPNNIEQKIASKKYKILVGDLCEDEKMVSEKDWDNTIKIGILNKKIEENLEIYKRKFDIVLTNEDATFQILNSIIM